MWIAVGMSVSIAQYIVRYVDLWFFGIMSPNILYFTNMFTRPCSLLQHMSVYK